MSTLNGSMYRRTVNRSSVYSDSLQLPQTDHRRSNGLIGTPQPTMMMSSHHLGPPSPLLARAPSSSRARTPTMTSEVAAVDPTLEDAQKTGNNYHITMSLNAALADAGLPTGSVAMATGRRSQMDYATTNSRASQASDYGGINQQRPSRLGFAPSSRTTPIDNRPGSVSVVRVTGNDDVHLTGNDILAHAHFSFPVTQPRGDDYSANESYTIRSVHPSAGTTVAQKESLMSVSERPKSRVGFDLELFGGQTTVVTETTSTATPRQREQHGGGKEHVVTEYVEREHVRREHGGRDHGGRDGRDHGGRDPGGRDPGGRDPGGRLDPDDDDVDHAGGTIAGLSKAARPRSGVGALPKAAPRSGANGNDRSNRDTVDNGSAPNTGDNVLTRNTAPEWREERPPKKSDVEKRSNPNQRQMWNPGDSTKHISQSQVQETKMERPTGGMVGGGLRGTSGDPHAGAMTSGSGRGGGGEDVDGYESIEYETVHPWLINGRNGGGGGGGGSYGDGMEDESIVIYRSLAEGADPSTVRQEVTYGEREMEIVRQKNGRIQQDLINVDIVSENVTVVVGNDVAQMTIKVRTERIVPIDDSKELFQKSSVTVTRLIEVDMTATPERQRIYHQVLESQGRGGGGGGGRRTLLSQKQTFDLYKAFLMLTETGPGDATHEQVRIDKETDQAMTNRELQRELHLDDDHSMRQTSVSTSSGRNMGYRQRIM